MCGIVGRVDFDGTDLSQLDLSAALTSLRARGPDAQGTWRRQWAALGHTRLAIVDLDERSNQPFISDDLMKRLYGAFLLVIGARYLFWDAAVRLIGRQ